MGAGSGLRGCTVVVTRPAEQAEALVAPLRALGAAVRVHPLVRIGVPPDGGAALQAALEQLGSYDWVVFTSTNAVHQCLAAAPAGSAWPRVACVGEATARVAREYGLVVEVMPATFTGEALPPAMAEHARLRGARVFWPRASGAGAAVREGLAAAGAVVVDVAAYETVEDLPAGRALQAELAAAPADVVTLTSPSAVRVFAASGGGYAGAVAVIGKVTGRAARNAGLAVVVEPATHTVAALVDAVERWWTSGRGP